MINNIVFDSSALIALFAKEPGYEKVRQNMKHAIISSVNLAEVYKYCFDVQNLTEEDCVGLIKLCGIKIIDFCAEQALISAKIVKTTKQYGLSLGDRGCIALALVKNSSILTCDKIWQKVDFGVPIIMAR